MTGPVRPHKGPPVQKKVQNFSLDPQFTQTFVFLLM